MRRERERTDCHLVSFIKWKPYSGAGIGMTWMGVCERENVCVCALGTCVCTCVCEHSLPHGVHSPGVSPACSASAVQSGISMARPLLTSLPHHSTISLP